jgi:hypothetical protein
MHSDHQRWQLHVNALTRNDGLTLKVSLYTEDKPLLFFIHLRYQTPSSRIQNLQI